MSPPSTPSTGDARQSDLPKRNSKKLKPVSPPLSSTHLHRLIYLLVLLGTILIAFYSYQIVQLKSEVGGWWNLALGRRMPATPNMHGHGFQGKANGKGKSKKDSKGGDERESVEEHINALAIALGMPPKDLARAIAGAVREYVPPASLSSIKEKETGGPAVDEMLKEKQGGGGNAGEGTGVAGGVLEGIQMFAGMDEP